MFSDWWIVIVCCTVAVIAHFLVNRNSNFLIACIDALLHVGVIIMFLFLEMALRQLFVFMLFSVATDLTFRAVFIFRDKRKKENEEQQNKSKDEEREEKK